jgi:large subunit ribosomal protein L18e
LKKTRTTNPELIKLIMFLRKQSNENKAEIWRTVAERLAKPRRRTNAVNISRLNRFTKKGEMVVVSGKVLGTGEISHPITVTAFSFSARARDKINAAKGKCMSFADLIKKDPKGSKVKIIG